MGKKIWQTIHPRKFGYDVAYVRTLFAGKGRESGASCQCRCRSLGCLQLQRHSQKSFSPPPPDFQSDELSSLLLSLSEVFSTFW